MDLNSKKKQQFPNEENSHEKNPSEQLEFIHKERKTQEKDASFLKRKYLVEFPEDFYQFYQFCKKLNPTNPLAAISNDLNLKLVGPYEVLSGEIDVEQLPPADVYQLDRYYYDPPEMVTVLASTNSNLHFGYFRDDPEELAAFLVKNNPDLKASSRGKLDYCLLEKMGDNLFAVLLNFIDDLLGKSFWKARKRSAKGVDKTKQNFNLVREKILVEINRLKLSPLKTASKIPNRPRKVVCPLFHGVGLVVPVVNHVGYRELPESDVELVKLFRNVHLAVNDVERSKFFDRIQELITLCQFANDESDYGEGLELGLQMFLHGSQLLHSRVAFLAGTAYQFLNRPLYGDIIKAHLKNRQWPCSKLN